MSNSGNNRDWSSASESLFRAARRAHDPTPADRARIDAALARVGAVESVASITSSGASTPTPKTSRSRSEPLVPAAPKPTRDGTRDELELVRRMDAAVRDKDFKAALQLCDEHQRHWPHGIFAFEREGVKANAPDAAEKAEHFLASHANVPIAMRVTAACHMKPR